MCNFRNSINNLSMLRTLHSSSILRKSSWTQDHLILLGSKYTFHYAHLSTPMLSASRRCCASLANNLRSSSTFQYAVPKSVTQVYLRSTSQSLKSIRPALQSQVRHAATAAAVAPDNTIVESDATVTEFADLQTKGLVSRTVVDTLIRRMGLKTMTPVQSQTVHETIQGHDV